MWWQLNHWKMCNSAGSAHRSSTIDFVGCNSRPRTKPCAPHQQLMQAPKKRCPAIWLCLTIIRSILCSSTVSCLGPHAGSQQRGLADWKIGLEWRKRVKCCIFLGQAIRTLQHFRGDNTIKLTLWRAPFGIFGAYFLYIFQLSHVAQLPFTECTSRRENAWKRWSDIK